MKVCVIVPVKDEAETILKTLDSLRIQKHRNGTFVSFQNYEVLILANNCQDQTYAIIKEYQSHYPKFPLQVEEILFSEQRAHIGTARRFLMDMAYNRFDFLDKPNGIIASTDGDTRVDTYWISEIIREMEKGCDVVGGEIITDIEIGFSDYHLQDIYYRNLIARLEFIIDPQIHNPWPSHFQCFGASFAINCQMYKKAGRLPPIPYLEDVAFNKALELKDAKIRKSPTVKVYTSSRTSGRVEKGLSQQLAWFESLKNANMELKVESAESIISKLKFRRLFRDLWIGLQGWECKYPFEESQVRQWLSESNYFGELWEKGEEFLERENWYVQWKFEDIDKVIENLLNYEKTILQPENFKFL